MKPLLQVNALTHWLDASNIYGSTDEEENNLRTRQGGLMKVSRNNQLPISREAECEARSRGAQCFTAGMNIFITSNNYKIYLY